MNINKCYESKFILIYNKKKVHYYKMHKQMVIWDSKIGCLLEQPCLLLILSLPLPTTDLFTSFYKIPVSYLKVSSHV